MEIDVNIKIETRKWIGSFNWDAVGTLTFKTGTSDKQAERIMRNFWGRANQALYGHAWRRFNKRIENFTMPDKNADGENPHYHLIIKMPMDRYTDVDMFCAFLRQQWRKVCEANFVCEFEAIDNVPGWINYITRKTGKDNCDNLHTHSSHVMQTRS
jgi:hypothetical protein